jgi:hypothetical protein
MLRPRRAEVVGAGPAEPADPAAAEFTSLAIQGFQPFLRSYHPGVSNSFYVGSAQNDDDRHETTLHSQI